MFQTVYSNESEFFFKKKYGSSSWVLTAAVNFMIQYPKVSS